jgi:hypothetical protein
MIMPDISFRAWLRMQPFSNDEEKYRVEWAPPLRFSAPLASLVEKVLIRHHSRDVAGIFFKAAMIAWSA